MPYQIKNGIIYSGNAVTLTQAQYDALTTAEKNNGTVYYIYDSDAMIEAQEVGLDGGNVETLAGSVATFESSPSTAVHAEGEYILYQAQLYKVTSAIAVGEDLTVGSNIEATNLGNELNAGLTPVTLSLTSNYTLTNASFTMGKLVVVSCKVAGLNGSSNLEVATIPSAYVPDTEIPLVGTTNSGVLITGWIRAYTGELVIAPRSSLSNAEARVLAVYHI